MHNLYVFMYLIKIIKPDYRNVGSYSNWSF